MSGWAQALEYVWEWVSKSGQVSEYVWEWASKSGQASV